MEVNREGESSRAWAKAQGEFWIPYPDIKGSLKEDFPSTKSGIRRLSYFSLARGEGLIIVVGGT